MNNKTFNIKRVLITITIIISPIILYFICLFFFPSFIRTPSYWNGQRRHIANDARTALEAYYSKQRKYPKYQGTVYDLITSQKLKNYITGDEKNYKDPKKENNRLCYSNKGENEYWLYMNPEPNEDFECKFPGPYSEPLEDYSMID